MVTIEREPVTKAVLSPSCTAIALSSGKLILTSTLYLPVSLSGRIVALKSLLDQIREVRLRFWLHQRANANYALSKDLSKFTIRGFC